MAYNPGISYQGDRYLFEGIGGLGGDFADAIKEREQRAKEDEYNNMIVQHAHEQGQVDDDWLNKYEAASHSAKTGMAAGLAANIVSDWKQKSEQAQIANLRAQTDYHYAMGEKARANAYDTGGDPGFSPSVTTLNDPATGKPFSVYFRGPNQVELTPGSKAIPPAGSPAFDNEGNVFGVWNAHGAVDKFTKKPTPKPMEEAIADIIKGGGEKPATSGPQTPPLQPSAPPSGKVRVISPDGVPGFVPSERLKDYLAAGYKQG